MIRDGRLLNMIYRTLATIGGIVMAWALLSMLAGCGLTPEREWYRGGEPSKHVVWVQVPWNEIPAKCGPAKYANHSVWACAVQIRETSTCYIFSGFPEHQAHYLYTSHMDDLYSHEMRHCSGERH